VKRDEFESAIGRLRRSVTLKDVVSAIQNYLAVWGEVLLAEQEHWHCDYCGKVNCSGRCKLVPRADAPGGAQPERRWENKIVDEIKRMDIREFREVGYLQEINRQFLHPLGLALEVVVGDDGTERLGGIWDYREDPAGVRYGTILDEGKAKRVCAIQRSCHEMRTAILGWAVQPVGEEEKGAGHGDEDGGV